MIVLCNGLAKSGSSFIFQIAESLAESAGFNQKSLRNQYVPNTFIPYKPHPHFVSFPPGELSQLVQSVPTSQLLVVKTHDPFSQEAAELLILEKIKVINSYRNPRDAAVSLWDAAVKERLTVKEEKWRFTVAPSFQKAIIATACLSSNNIGWLQDKKTLNIGFDRIRIEPIDVAEAIANYLQLQANSFPIAAKYIKNRKDIREYSIGIPERFITYMSLFEEGLSNQLFQKYDEMIELTQDSSIGKANE